MRSSRKYPQLKLLRKRGPFFRLPMKEPKSSRMALKAKSNETDESSDDEDSKMKSYITRQFKKFMKNANAKGFDKDRKQSSSS